DGNDKVIRLILHDAVIVCGKKEMHVPLKKRTLVMKGDDCVSRLKVVSCMKVKKYVDRGSYLFVSHVVEMESAKRRLEDVPVICEFPDVFPGDLPGLPPPRQVEFQIQLVPEAAPVPIPLIASFGQNFHFGESSSTANLLTGNSKFVSTGPMCLNLGMAWRRLGKMEKLMLERIDTEGKMKKRFKEQDHHFVGLGCDNIKMDRAVRNVMLDLSGLKNFPLPLGSQVREPPTEPSPRPVPALHPDDPYVVTRDTTAAVVAVATFGINDDDYTVPMDSQPYEPRCDNIKMDRAVRNVMLDLSGLKKLVKGLSDRFDEDTTAAVAVAVATFGIDDDDDTAPMDSQPYEPRGSPRDTQKSTRGNPPPPLTQDTVNRMIQESVEVAIRAERERVQNEEICAGGPNVAPVARECTFADFMKCSPITFRGNK
nr:reverse transcriptase domain-containing protein [Tanacetum cinerariifolium]